MACKSSGLCLITTWLHLACCGVLWLPTAPGVLWLPTAPGVLWLPTAPGVLWLPTAPGVLWLPTAPGVRSVLCAAYLVLLFRETLFKVCGAVPL
jgi:hypothetical protein